MYVLAAALRARTHARALYMFTRALVSVAIVAVGMARLVTDSTSTAARCVATAIWSPASLFGDPADFRLAHQAADPVAAVFLLDDDVTPWTLHGLPVLQHTLEHLLGLLSRLVVLRSDAQVILVVPAIHAFMDGPAQNAVGFVAEFTDELVDLILVDAPPSTVGSLTVEAVLGAALCDAQAQLQHPLVLFV